MPRTSSKVKSRPGFSNRFNQLLDWSGYPERGRGATLAKQLNQNNTNRTVIYPWLTRDIVPLNLKAVVETILSNCPGYASANSVVEWLLNADESKNPKDTITLQQFQNIDHQQLSKVLITVHNIANKLDINIGKIPSHHIDLIYTTILKQVTRSPKQAINETIIADLLVSALSIQQSK